MAGMAFELARSSLSEIQIYSGDLLKHEFLPTLTAECCFFFLEHDPTRFLAIVTIEMKSTAADVIFIAYAIRQASCKVVNLGV